MASVKIVTCRGRSRQHHGVAVDVDTNQPVYTGPDRKTHKKAIKAVRNALRNTSHVEVG